MIHQMNPLRRHHQALNIQPASATLSDFLQTFHPEMKFQNVK